MKKLANAELAYTSAKQKQQVARIEFGESADGDRGTILNPRFRYLNPGYEMNRHCERSEAIQQSVHGVWIASSP